LEVDPLATSPSRRGGALAIEVGDSRGMGMRAKQGIHISRFPNIIIGRHASVSNLEHPRASRGPIIIEELSQKGAAEAALCSC